MLYPMVLDLEGRRVLVVGAGLVAERKVQRLMKAGAKVVVVAPEVCASIGLWAERGELVLRRRLFREDDVAGMSLVFAATDSVAKNDEVVLAARAAGILANSAAGAEHDFVVPASGEVDEIGIAVWSGSPALSKRLRDELVGVVDERWQMASQVFERLRPTIGERADGQARGAFWRNLAAGVPAEFRSVAIAKRFVRAVGRGAGLPLGDGELDTAFDEA